MKWGPKAALGRFKGGGGGFGPCAICLIGFDLIWGMMELKV